MPNAVTQKPLISPFIQAKLLRLQIQLSGLLKDFWKDGPLNGPAWMASCISGLFNSFNKTRQSRIPRAKDAVQSTRQLTDQGQDIQPISEPSIWTADKVQVVEAMWGEGHALPGGDEYLTSLSSPLGLNSEMSVLDLSSGLGDLARKLADEYKTYVTGMEPDSLLAARAMVMSIAQGKSKMAPVMAYDPVNYAATRKYDSIFARELFYKIIGKEKFFKAIDSSLKNGGGQLVFTDYILDPSARERPAIANWLKRETGAAPLSSIERIKLWKGMGYDLRIAEDQTAMYKDYIRQGLRQLVDHMIFNRPDVMTKKLVVREVDLWLKRVEAFSQGLKYYRFFAIKH
jgi:2-polyprenyl-3-methyl-5-hydroxy-6-metoxy-1,4-benzoquinol methylase